MEKKTSCSIEIPNALRMIAFVIEEHWPDMYFGAVPYVAAMYQLNSIHDMYGADSAESIVRYFLGNAKTWRGDVARAVKQKLNELLKES